MLNDTAFRVALLAASVAVLVACGAEPGAEVADPEPAVAQAPAATVLGPKVFPLEAAPALDDPGRDEWQRPDEVVAALGIRPGQRVADVGCGTGYFTLRLARAVGPDGHVLAVDIQQGMLDILAQRLDAENRTRVELRCTAPARPLAPADRIDLALLANTLHEVDDPGAFLHGLSAGLASDGRLAAINWLPWRTQFGPPVENRISPESVKELAEAAGLRLEREVELLPMHSFQIFRKHE